VFVRSPRCVAEFLSGTYLDLDGGTGNCPVVRFWCQGFGVPRLLRFATAIEKLNAMFGKLCGWCLLVMVGFECTVVILRYALDMGYVWLQEAVVYLHVSVALLACAYALSRGAHVRVDVFYRNARRKKRALVDLLGALSLLLPFSGVILITGWPFAAASWSVLEGSAQPSGIPAVFLLKTLVPGFAALLSLQALALVARSIMVLTSRDNDLEGHT